MEKLKVTIKGLTPLLMHSFPMVEIRNPEKLSDAEQAELAAYRDPETRDLYIPGIAVQRGLVAAAIFSKGKGRSSLQRVVAAGVFVFPERISLGQKKYEIDRRPVVIPATKGRVIRVRPRLDEWQASFSIEYDAELVTEKQLRQIVDDFCSKIGLLDFRPACKGSFGRSMVTSWQNSK